MTDPTRGDDWQPAPETCRHCGAALAPIARYCRMCGHPVERSLPGTFPQSVLPARRLPPGGQPPRHRAGELATAAALLALVAGLLVNRARLATALNPPEPRVGSPTLAAPTPTLPSYQLVTVVVPAGGSYRLTFPTWPAGTTLQGYFQVDTFEIGFRVQQPDGQNLVSLPDVAGRYDFSYTTAEAGRYSMVFANGADPQNDRQLVLVYRAYRLTTT